MKTVTITSSRFDAGMTQDVYDVTPHVTRICQAFDTFTFPHQLVPFRSSESITNSVFQIMKFCYANSKLYGLSNAGGGGEKLYSNTNFTTPLWGTEAGATDGYNGLTFVDYKKVGKLFFSRPSNMASFAYGSSTYASNASAIAATGQGIVHSKDDILYVPCANVIAKNDNDVWAPAALTLPSQFTITALSEYGNYLAIFCAPLNAQTNSVCFLWDRDSSVTTLAESIDWGQGNVQAANQVDGELLAISFDTLLMFKTTITVRAYAGGQPRVIATLISDTGYTAGDLLQDTQRIGKSLLFALTITIDGTKYNGVWKIGRSNSSSPWGLVFHRPPNNDTALSSGTINGFLTVGDYLFISYISATVYGMSKTDDQANYTATSVVETVINPSMPSAWLSTKKKLDYFTVFFSPLSSGQQVVAKYRVDSTAAYPTTTGTKGFIFTKTSSSPDTSLTLYQAKQDTAGKFDEGYQLQFRLESTGGAIITGYEYQVSDMPT